METDDYSKCHEILWRKLDGCLSRRNSKDPTKLFAPDGITRQVFEDPTLIELLISACPMIANESCRDRCQSIAQRIIGSEEFSKIPRFCNILATLVYARLKKATLYRFSERLVAPGELPSDWDLPLQEWKARDLFGDVEGPAFWNDQFLFCPVVLKLGSIYPAGCRLPFVKDEVFLDEGGYGAVSKVEVERGHICTDSGMYNKKASGSSLMISKFCLTIPQPKLYAQKVMQKKDFETEVSVTKKIIDLAKSHKNVLLPSATLDMGGICSLFFEYAKYSLDGYFSNSSISLETLDEKSEVFFRAIGLAGGLAFLHEDLISSEDAETVHFYHLDLKPANILVFETDDGGEMWKISDFGISKPKQIRYPSLAYEPKKLTSGVSAPCYGLTYAAPEARYAGDKVTREADVWSLGCVITLVLTFMDSQSAGIKGFMDIRLQDRQEDRFFAESGAPDRSKTNYIVHPPVLKWLKKLVSNGRVRSLLEGDAIQGAVRMLERHALCPDPSIRCSAKEFERKLIDVNSLFKNAREQDLVSKPQVDGLPKVGMLCSPQGRIPTDTRQNPSTSPADSTVDPRYGFPERNTPGRPIKIKQTVMSAVQQWLEGDQSSTLLVHGLSTKPRQQITCDLARHVKAAINNKSHCAVIYFCNPDTIEVPILDFLNFVNQQLAGFHQGSTVNAQEDKDSAGAMSVFRQGLENVVSRSSIPVFGIFHNMSWLCESTEDSKITLHEILDAFQYLQHLGALKLLYTTNGGTATGRQVLEDAVAQNDTIESFRHGPCPLTQLCIPKY